MLIRPANLSVKLQLCFGAVTARAAS